LLFVTLIDLNQNVERRCELRALLAQALSDLDSVHGMDPVEALGHLSRLVGLQPTDEVPGDRQIRE
jgi:hypothetical protein